MNAEDSISRSPAKRKTVRRPIAKKAKSGSSARGVPRKPIWERIAELGREIPLAERAETTHDGSINYRHYRYGAPKVSLDEQ